MANRSVESDSSFVDGDSPVDGDRLSRKSRGQKSKPFYEVSAGKPTSSQIINESKNWLLKPVRTERPFTPRDARRLLFADRSSSVDMDDSASRPTSGLGFDSSDLQSRPVSSVVKRLAPLNHVPELTSLEKTDAAGYEYDMESSRTAAGGVLLPHPPPSGATASTPTRIRNRRHSLTRTPTAEAPRKGETTKTNGTQQRRGTHDEIIAREHLTTSGSLRSASASSTEDPMARRLSSSSTDAERDHVHSASASSRDRDALNEAGRRVQSGPKERASPHDDGTPRAHSASNNNRPPRRPEDESSSATVAHSTVGNTSASAGRPPAAPNHGRRKDTSAGKSQHSSRRPEESDSARQRPDVSGSPIQLQLAGSDSSLNRTEATGSSKRHSTRPPEEQSAPGPKASEFERRVGILLDELEQARSTRDVTLLLGRIEALRRTLEAADELGRHCSMRIGILKALFAVLDTNEARVQLRTANLVLALRVSGNNLVNIARLIYRISKDERNDALFLEEAILERLVAVVTQYASYLADAHTAECACVVPDASGSSDALRRPASGKHRPSMDLLTYTVGCMRFLAGQNEMASELIQLGAFEALATLVSHMLVCCARLADSPDARADSRLSSAGAEPASQPPALPDPDCSVNPCNHCPQIVPATASSALIQIVGCVRNFLERSETRSICTSSTIVHDFCELLERFASSYELVLGVCRVLSKVSQFGEACHGLLRFRGSRSRTPLGSTLIHLLVQHRKQHDLVVRIAFVLGNLATRISTEQNDADNDETARESSSKRATVFESKRELTEFLTVLRYYVEHDRRRTGADTEQDRAAHEVMVKLVRVLANASLDERTGKMIAESKTCLKLIISLIERTEPNSDNEELLLNAISAVNNLSYYMISGDLSGFQDRQLAVAQKMLPLLNSEQPELITETVRVFGNLSRERAVRDLLVEQKMDRTLLALLETNDTELIYCTMGVLLNLMNDSEKRRILKHEHGVARLMRLLESVLPEDWYTASLICKTLWNFTDSLPAGSVAAALGGGTETRRFYEILTAFGNENFVRTRIRQVSSRRAKPADMNDETYDANTDAEDDEDSEARQASEWQLDIWRNEFCPVAQALAQRISQATAAGARTQHSAPHKSK